MKKKVVIFLLLMLFPCFVCALEEEESGIIFKNFNKLSADTYDEKYMTAKLDDGYVSASSWADDWSNTTRDRLAHISVRKVDNQGTIVWENEFTDRGEWVRTEQSALYLGKNNDVFISNHELTVRVDLSTGELLKQSTDIGCQKIVEYGDNLLCVGSGVFYDPFFETVRNNNLFIIDEDLNVLKTVNFYDRSEYIMTAAVENETIYAVTYYRDASRNYYYWLKTLDKDLNEVDSLTLDTEYFSDSGSLDMAKIGDNFYYVAQGLSKIDSDGKVTQIDSGDWGDGADYTEIEIVGDYVILAGLYNDGESNLNALVEVYDMNMELKQTINVNSDFGVDNNSSGMSIVKAIIKTENGFVASGLLDDNTSFISEYQFLYDITASTDNNGEIEVVSEAFSGDMITFRVSPRTGYKLSTLAVTNDALETVVFTEDDLILNDDGTVSVSVNSFKMPSSNVKIAALFEKIPENPNTFDNIVFYTGAFIISIFLIGGVLLYKRRYS